MDDINLTIPFDQYVLFKLLSIAQNNTIVVTKGQLATLSDYTPQFQVSNLASMFSKVTLKHMYISYADSDDSLGPFTKELLRTDMFSKYPAPFMLLVACYLEITAFNWACANQPVLLNNFSLYDIVRIRHNLNVLASWCGKHTNYLVFINKLRQLDVDLGFLETKYGYVLNHYGYEQSKNTLNAVPAYVSQFNHNNEPDDKPTTDTPSTIDKPTDQPSTDNPGGTTDTPTTGGQSPTDTPVTTDTLLKIDDAKTESARQALVNANNILATLNQDKNAWAGKTWEAIGDSITEVNFRATQGYVSKIVDRTGVTAINNGTSGYGYQTKDPQILSPAPDFVTVFLGVNDWLNVSKYYMPLNAEQGIPTKTGTVYYFIYKRLKKLADNYKNTPIGVILPLRAQEAITQSTDKADVVGAGGYTLAQIRSAIKTVAGLFNFPVLDMWDCGIDPWKNSEFYDEYGRNGNVYLDTTGLEIGSAIGSKKEALLHPNEKGHRITSVYIEKFIAENLLNKTVTNPTITDNAEENTPQAKGNPLVSKVSFSLDDGKNWIAHVTGTTKSLAIDIPDTTEHVLVRIDEAKTSDGNTVDVNALNAWATYVATKGQLKSNFLTHFAHNSIINTLTFDKSAPAKSQSVVFWNDWTQKYTYVMVNNINGNPYAMQANVKSISKFNFDSGDGNGYKSYPANSIISLNTSDLEGKEVKMQVSEVNLTDGTKSTDTDKYCGYRYYITNDPNEIFTAVGDNGSIDAPASDKTGNFAYNSGKTGQATLIAYDQLNGKYNYLIIKVN